jgi:hypothetical protein
LAPEILGTAAALHMPRLRDSSEARFNAKSPFWKIHSSGQRGVIRLHYSTLQVSDLGLHVSASELWIDGDCSQVPNSYMFHIQLSP